MKYEVYSIIVHTVQLSLKAIMQIVIVAAGNCVSKAIVDQESMKHGVVEPL